MEPSLLSLDADVIATFFHLTMVVYNATLLHRIRKIVREDWARFDPRGEIPQYAGQFKFLTHINLWSQLAFFSLELVLDLLPDYNTFKQEVQSHSSFAFATLIFPLAWFVTTTFWGVYIYDSKLIYKEISQVINHLSHTFIVLWVVVEAMLQDHYFPGLSTAVVPIVTGSLAYVSWVEWIHAATGFWVYPIFNRLPSRVYFIPFYGLSILLCIGLYLVGRTVSDLFWR